MAVEYSARGATWSTTRNVGFWFLNPSVGYLSGGPTKVEFLGDRDTNDVEAPTVLSYWRSSHYGGAVVDVVHGEHWTKVIGPFLLYWTGTHFPRTCDRPSTIRGVFIRSIHSLRTI